jgi:hypothetical protein
MAVVVGSASLIGRFLVPSSIIAKPVIYLYPEEEERVTVKLDLKGEYEFSYPKYASDIGGWDVYASPDGNITDPRDGRTYSYIFWEGLSLRKPYDMSTGWVVEDVDTVEFLRDKLATFGFTEKEYNEFIVYWAPILQKNKFNLIHFATSEYEEIAPLDVNPKPDSILRVLMAYKPVAYKMEVTPQEIKPVTREGFVLVEWGGTLVK